MGFGGFFGKIAGALLGGLVGNIFGNKKDKGLEDMQRQLAEKNRKEKADADAAKESEAMRLKRLQGRSQAGSKRRRRSMLFEGASEGGSETLG